jgi:hypothetical protein
MMHCKGFGLIVLGMVSLAYAELYLTLAAVVRRFELRLWETGYGDIEAVFDGVMPLTKRDTKGVRVLVY